MRINHHEGLLTYCSNIHPGESWEKTLENLTIYGNLHPHHIRQVHQFVDFTFARFCKIRIGNIRNARSSVGTSGVGNATTGWIGRCHCPDCELLVVVLL